MTETNQFADDASTRLALPISNGIIYLEHKRIVRLQAEGGYTYVYCIDGNKHLTCKGIGELLCLLPPNVFFRSHHSHVINLATVVQAFRNGGYRVQLITGEEVEVSRRKWGGLKKAMSELR